MMEFYLIFGIASPLCYVLAVIIGGFLIPGYSHTYNSISELTASNAPKRPIIFILFLGYNLLLSLFGAGLYTGLENSSSTLVKAASIITITVGILGIAMLYYVQDPRNIPMSFKGKMHLVLAGISSILTMIIIVFLGLSFRNNGETQGLALYSFITFAVVFVTGGITGVSIAKDSRFGGLFERLTIGAFIQWVFVIALTLF